MIDFNIYDCIVVRKSGRKGFEKMPVNFLKHPTVLIFSKLKGLLKGFHIKKNTR